MFGTGLEEDTQTTVMLNGQCLDPKVAICPEAGHLRFNGK